MSTTRIEMFWKRKSGEKCDDNLISARESETLAHLRRAVSASRVCSSSQPAVKALPKPQNISCLGRQTLKVYSTHQRVHGAGQRPILHGKLSTAPAFSLRSVVVVHSRFHFTFNVLILVWCSVLIRDSRRSGLNHKAAREGEKRAVYSRSRQLHRLDVC